MGIFGRFFPIIYKNISYMAYLQKNLDIESVVFFKAFLNIGLKINNNCIET
jgi:hypothetical protein